MAKYRLTLHEFTTEVRRCLRAIPEPFQSELENVVVDVEEVPTADDLASVDEETEFEDDLLLGLFQGVPLTEQAFGERHPNRVILFRRPLEEVSDSVDELRKNIRETILHELAHHFGYSEEDLEEFERRCNRDDFDDDAAIGR
ncbi:MAG: metallopeptidase family protein [Planctomycetota bacterium]